MSIPVSVFIPRSGRRWDYDALQANILRNGFELQLTRFHVTRHLGMLPCVYNGHAAAFEYYRDSRRAYMREVRLMRRGDPEDFPYTASDLERIRGHHHVVQLLTHSGFRDRVAAVISAACLANLTGGWVLDEPVWEWVGGAEALRWAKAVEVEMADDIAARE